jgi:hypothetical protein
VRRLPADDAFLRQAHTGTGRACTGRTLSTLRDGQATCSDAAVISERPCRNPVAALHVADNSRPEQAAARTLWRKRFRMAMRGERRARPAGTGVSRVMNANRSYTGMGTSSGEAAIEVTWINWGAELGDEHEVVAGPGLTGRFGIGESIDASLLQGSHA